MTADGTRADDEVATTDVEYEAVGRGRWLFLAVMVPIVVVGALLIGRALRDGDVTSRLQTSQVSGLDAYDYEYVIPVGTADRIAAGEEIAIVPADLTVTLGESIRIVNDDEQGHQVGAFYVGAGETLSQRFGSTGVFENECTVHPSGAFRLTVLDP